MSRPSLPTLNARSIFSVSPYERGSVSPNLELGQYVSGYAPTKPVKGTDHGPHSPILQYLQELPFPTKSWTADKQGGIRNILGEGFLSSSIQSSSSVTSTIRAKTSRHPILKKFKNHVVFALLASLYPSSTNLRHVPTL
jgi:hypothetical protein